MAGVSPDIDLDEVVARYRPLVSFKVRRSIGGAAPDWEDVTNEILTQVIAKVRAGEFRGESSIGTFIYTVTSRRIVDFIRDKGRLLRHAPEPGDLPDPQDRLELGERSARLAEAVRSLPPKYRDVLGLYFYRELPREEVARRLGIPPAKVSERVNYAQKLLRKLLLPDVPFRAPGAD